MFRFKSGARIAKFRKLLKDLVLEILIMANVFSSEKCKKPDTTDSFLDIFGSGKPNNTTPDITDSFLDVFGSGKPDDTDN